MKSPNKIQILNLMRNILEELLSMSCPNTEDLTVLQSWPTQPSLVESKMYLPTNNLWPSNWFGSH
jgi:hypothetical protein